VDVTASFRESRPLAGQGRKNTVRGKIIRLAAAWLGILGEFIMQCAGQTLAELAGQADEQLVAGKIKAQRHAGGPVVLSRSESSTRD